MRTPDRFSVDEIITAWMQVKRATGVYTPERVALRHAILQSLAEGRPISQTQAVAASGLSAEKVAALFAEMAESGGADFDADGRIVGLALTLTPTPHRFRVDGRQLYAWCAIDTLFLPGQIGRSAQVESVCPISGALIRLTITPHGVTAVEPDSMVISVDIPGHAIACETGDHSRDGAAGASCSSMHYLRTRAEGEQWRTTHPNVAILSLADAWRVAESVWIEPFRQALAALPGSTPAHISAVPPLSRA